MKCYVIKSGNTYIANYPRVLQYSYWRGVDIRTTIHEDEVKHYRSRSQASGWVKKTLDKLTKDNQKAREDYEKYYDPRNMYHYRSQNAKNRYESIDKIMRWLENSTVDQIDVEKPSFIKKVAIRWCQYRIHHKTQAQGLMKIDKVTHGRWYCKSCGLQLKNIPFYNLYESTPTRVCIPCLQLRLDNIKSAYESMDEDVRTEITNELMLGSM